MTHSDQERLADAIAENVVSILKHKPAGCGFASAGHEAVLAGLLHELLAVMPTASSDTLATACNRLLDRLPSTDEQSPWVEAVDPAGGGVTMRAGKRRHCAQADPHGFCIVRRRRLP